jgi:mRNA interferase MazF
MAVTVLQGEVWDVNLNPVVGHEQGGFRPALVISGTWFNTIGLDLVIVAAITSKAKDYDFEVPVSPPEGGLTAESVVLAHQVRTDSHDRLARRRGQVRTTTLQAVLATLDAVNRP